MTVTKRNETRRERYAKKRESAIRMPLGIVTINFDFDDNLAFIIRTAACYGLDEVYVIGQVPPRKLVHPKSGSLSDVFELRSFKNPGEFLQFIRDNDYHLISAELTDDAMSIHEYAFDFDKKTLIVLGNETTGVPVEILINSEVVYIPMPGIGYCLNTSQTGTAMIHEYSRQYFDWRKNEG